MVLLLTGPKLLFCSEIVLIVFTSPVTFAELTLIERMPCFSKQYKWYYTTLTDFSTNYLVMCKVYTDVGGIK